MSEAKLRYPARKGSMMRRVSASKPWHPSLRNDYIAGLTLWDVSACSLALTAHKGSCGVHSIWPIVPSLRGGPIILVDNRIRDETTLSMVKS